MEQIIKMALIVYTRKVKAYHTIQVDNKPAWEAMLCLEDSYNQLALYREMERLCLNNYTYVYSILTHGMHVLLYLSPLYRKY